VAGVVRPNYSSVPGHRLSCRSEGKLVLATDNDNSAAFQSTGVDFDNHLRTVIDQRLADEQACLQSCRNTTVDDAMFAYNDRNQFLTVCVNCSAGSFLFPFAHEIFSFLNK
jgi:hypothetical protein